MTTVRRALDPGWTPHAFDSSTQAWFTAAAGVATDPNNSAVVVSWTDQLHGNVVNQTFAPGRPQYRPNGWGTGVPTVTFGGNQLLQTAASWTGVPTGAEPAFTILAVLRSAAPQTAAVAGFWDVNGGGYATAGVKQVGTLTVLDSWRVFSNAPGQMLAGSLDLGTSAHVVAWRYDPTTGVLTQVIDGVPASSSRIPAIGPLPAMPLIVGAKSLLPTGMFQGDLSELMIIGRALSDDEIQNYVDYSRSHWQITTPPPSGNPCVDANNVATPESTRCDDQNSQTYGDHCSQGACIGTVPFPGSPAGLSPLAWYHASPQEVVVTDTGVSTWFDRSPNHLDLMQPFYYGRPALISTWPSGKPALHFNGGNGLRRDAWPGPPVGSSQAFTVLAVFQSGSPGQSSSIASWWNSSYSHTQVSLTASNGDSAPSMARGDETGSTQSLTDPVALGTGPHAVVWRYTPDVLTVTVDGQSLSSGALTPLGPMFASTFLVGMQTYLPTGLFTGDLAELAIVPRSISDDEVAAFDRYVAVEWLRDDTTGVSCQASQVARLPLDPVQPFDLAGDTTRIYWTDPTAGTVNVAGRDGSGRGTLVSGRSHLAGLAVDDSFVYFADDLESSVSRLPTSGGTPAIIAYQQRDPLFLSSDGDHLVWTNQGTGHGDGSVRQYTKSTGHLDAIASSQPGPWMIASLAGRAYWSDVITGSVFSGTPVDPIVTIASSLRAPAVAAGAAAHLLSADGRLYDIDGTTGGALPRIASPAGAFFLAVSDPSAFWTNGILQSVIEQGSAGAYPFTVWRRPGDSAPRIVRALGGSIFFTVTSQSGPGSIFSFVPDTPPPVVVGAPVCAPQAVGPACDMTAAAITPFLDCVFETSDQRLIAHFGYTNADQLTRRLGVGPENQFDRGDGDACQPTTFAVGTHHDVFAVGFAGEVTWTVGQRSATASASSTRCAAGAVRATEVLP